MGLDRDGDLVQVYCCVIDIFVLSGREMILHFLFIVAYERCTRKRKTEERRTIILSDIIRFTMPIQRSIRALLFDIITDYLSLAIIASDERYLLASFK